MGYNTTIGDEPWKYIDLLNACLQILLTVLLGMVFGYFKIFDAKALVPQATRFVFYVALPLVVLKALGVGIDFYDLSAWTFILLFLALRGIGLLVAFACVFIRGRWENQGLGDVAVIWLSLTWISTIILGVPISTAVFGNEALGYKYGVLAAISSFIFQLPFQLFFLEYDVATRASGHSNIRRENKNSAEVAPEKDVEADASVESLQENKGQEKGQGRSQVEKTEIVWRVVTLLAWNPVVWGITCGFVLTLSTLGPTFLNPKKPDFVPGMGWFWRTTTWLGDCVSPVSLFTMGVWMQSQGRRMFQLKIHEAFLFMLSKLILLPAIMLVLALAADLNDEAGRASVLIASLPISMASFSLASNYNMGRKTLSMNVALGTMLLLPTVIIWNLILDSMDLFPITSTTPTNNPIAPTNNCNATNTTIT